QYAEFFVTLHGWYTDPECLYMPMEYCEHLDLGTYLRRHKSLPEDQVHDIGYQLLQGLSRMHDNGFAHRDLKPANVLIKRKPPEAWWVKLCDLGLSRRSSDASGSTTVRFTPDFMAPELI
ncbi:kinase-like protein, partial [Ophiobolus disseminans]